jgi:hypothetical protein
VACYEIDRLISRTLAYAIVTGLLVGVYAGLVLLATEVLGQGSRSIRAGMRLRMPGLLAVSGVAVIAPSSLR